MHCLAEDVPPSRCQPSSHDTHLLAPWCSCTARRLLPPAVGEPLRTCRVSDEALAANVTVWARAAALLVRHTRRTRAARILSWGAAAFCRLLGACSTTCRRLGCWQRRQLSLRRRQRRRRPGQRRPGQRRPGRRRLGCCQRRQPPPLTAPTAAAPRPAAPWLLAMAATFRSAAPTAAAPRAAAPRLLATACQCRLATPLLDGLASPRLLSTDSPRHASCQQTRLAAPCLNGLALPRLLSTDWPRRTCSPRACLAAPPLKGVAPLHLLTTESPRCLWSQARSAAVL